MLRDLYLLILCCMGNLYAEVLSGAASAKARNYFPATKPQGPRSISHPSNPIHINNEPDYCQHSLLPVWEYHQT